LYIKRAVDCATFTANDGCAIRELLHPANAGLELPYSLAAGEVLPGARTCRHQLSGTEVYCILEGSGVMHIDSESRACMPGDIILVPSGAAQWLHNPGINTLRFLCIVSPPWQAEGDVLLEPSSQSAPAERTT
jgi:mannose-6-phosphate isomerase-like protein (cupin superfamily)